KDGRTRCQAIAKWQQTVEKIIKAIVAALREAGILSVQIGYRHDVEKFVRVLIRLPRATENKSIQQHLLASRYFVQNSERHLNWAFLFIDSLMRSHSNEAWKSCTP